METLVHHTETSYLSRGTCLYMQKNNKRYFVELIEFLGNYPTGGKTWEGTRKYHHYWKCKVVERTKKHKQIILNGKTIYIKD